MEISVDPGGDEPQWCGEGVHEVIDRWFGHRLVFTVEYELEAEMRGAGGLFGGPDVATVGQAFHVLDLAICDPSVAFHAEHGTSILQVALELLDVVQQSSDDLKHGSIIHTSHLMSSPDALEGGKYRESEEGLEAAGQTGASVFC